MDDHFKDTSQAQILLPSQDLTKDMAFFSELGFRLDQIFPSDDPAVAVMSGYGMQIRLDKNTENVPATILIFSDQPERIANGEKQVTAPNGTKVLIRKKENQYSIPPTQHKFEVRRLQDNDPWVIGRAGMLYRDLIPDRLGGSIIASHIRIPEGGPVPDMVHYHTIGFQLIFCYSGWVKLVYEDQGPPFILKAGDCVTQPPEIRHRVLEASDNLEVIEIGVPSEHMTTIDHEMELPTKSFRPNRTFQGQKFCHHLLEKANWNPWKINGFTFRDTGILEATKGVASVHVARPTLGFETEQKINHSADILFTFLMEGQLTLHAEGEKVQVLKRGDAFVIPPNMKYHFSDWSKDLELLEVVLS